MNLILASASPYRCELLKREGFEFQSIPSELDEEEFKKRYSDPQRLVQILASEKAKVVFDQYPGSIVIGSDQLLCQDKKIYGKPGTLDAAKAQLRELRGQSQLLLTAVCILSPGEIWEYMDVTELKMKNLSDQQIDEYVELDRPVDCAGAFKFESHGHELFENVRCEDETAIQGLPMQALKNYLRQTR